MFSPFLVFQKEDVASLPGYLSLHQGAEGLTLKWTPNQLMNGCHEEEEKEVDRRSVLRPYEWNMGVNHILYRKTSSISRTKSQNLNVSNFVVQLSLLNPLKPGVKSRMKMKLEHRRQAMLQLHLSCR